MLLLTAFYSRHFCTPTVVTSWRRGYMVMPKTRASKRSKNEHSILPAAKSGVGFELKGRQSVAATKRAINFGGSNTHIRFSHSDTTESAQLDSKHSSRRSTRSSVRLAQDDHYSETNDTASKPLSAADTGSDEKKVDSYPDQPVTEAKSAVSSRRQTPSVGFARDNNVQTSKLGFGHKRTYSNKNKKTALQMLHSIDNLLESAGKYQYTNSVYISKSAQSPSEKNGDQSHVNRTVYVVTKPFFNKYQQSSNSAITTIQVQPLLVLDLNGILCTRYRRNRNPVSLSHHRASLGRVTKTPIIPRNDLATFLTYLDAHFCLAVWTSGKEATAKGLVDILFPKDIADRLLFVWGQNACTVLAERDEHGVPIFEKNLSRVWVNYPLWNAANTLLYDDSPDKCSKWHENAVHPPPLNGLTKDGREQFAPDMLCDLYNEEQQLAFFEKFIQHWRNNSSTQIWDEETADIVTSNSARSQKQFLQTHAVGHMGWEPMTKNYYKRR